MGDPVSESPKAAREIAKASDTAIEKAGALGRWFALGSRTGCFGQMNLDRLQQIDNVGRSHKLEEQWLR